LYDIPEANVDTFGQPSQAEMAIGTFWAEVRPLEGDEKLNVRQIWPTATHDVRMRWLGTAIPVTSDNPSARILPQMVLNCLSDNTYLHILYANNVEKRNRQWQIYCEEKVGAVA
jgi:hypothetical protein